MGQHARGLSIFCLLEKNDQTGFGRPVLHIFEEKWDRELQGHDVIEEFGTNLLSQDLLFSIKGENFYCKNATNKAQIYNSVMPFFNENLNWVIYCMAYNTKSKFFLSIDDLGRLFNAIGNNLSNGRVFQKYLPSKKFKSLAFSRFGIPEKYNIDKNLFTEASFTLRPTLHELYWGEKMPETDSLHRKMHRHMIERERNQYRNLRECFKK